MDELWMPKDIMVRRLAVELDMADVHILPGGPESYIPGMFGASAIVLLGTDGANDPIWKEVHAHGGTVSAALENLWALARRAKQGTP